MKNNNNKIQSGYVMITVLILMMVLVAILYLFADVVFAEQAVARNNKGAQVAFSLAEAGVQEAIYRVQYDTAPGGARDNFLNNGPNTTFSHSAPALIAQGSYEVIIDSTTQGVATITSTGRYAMGLRTAKREVQTTIAEATVSQPYDEGIFTHSTNAGDATGDIELDGATIQIFDSGISSGRDIKIDDSNIQTEGPIEYVRNQTGDDSTVKCDCLINDDSDPLTSQCSDAPQCTLSPNLTPGEMPEVDFISYESQAKNTPGPSPDGNQYFDNQRDFLDLVNAGTDTFNGVVYINGSLTINGDLTLTVNGLLVAGGPSGSITVGKNSGSTTTTLNINNPGNNLSGVLVENNFIVNSKGHFSGNAGQAQGLIYAGIKTDFKDSTNTINLIGGIISRRIYVTSRTLIIHFNMDIVNTVIGDYAPVIEINHWEEEY